MRYNKLLNLIKPKLLPLTYVTLKSVMVARIKKLKKEKSSGFGKQAEAE